MQIFRDCIIYQSVCEGCVSSWEEAAFNYLGLWYLLVLDIGGCALPLDCSATWEYLYTAQVAKIPSF